MRIFGSFILLLFLTACQAPVLRHFAVNTYSEQQPIALDVSDITVVSKLTHFDRLPHIEQKLPISPEDALKEWASNRFDAANSTSPVKAVITINQAYMTQKEEKGATWYTLDNDAYQLTYEVNLSLVKNNQILYQYTSKGWESSSLPQRSSMADKEAAWQKMTNAMLRKINDQITNAIPLQFKHR